MAEVTIWRYEETFAYPKGASSINDMAVAIGTATQRVHDERGGRFISGGCGPIASGPTLEAALANTGVWQHALEQISHMHRKDETVGGMTSGECSECGLSWPCPTYHVAQGWGDSYLDCEEQCWCEHEAVPVERRTPTKGAR